MTEPGEISESCPCACHTGGAHVSCNVDGGHGVGCGPHVTEADEEQETGCRVCRTPTADGITLCTLHANEVERVLGDMKSLMHEVSLVATKQTYVYRAQGAETGPDPEIAELDEEYEHRMAAIPARLRSRDGRLALPATASVVNLEARDLLYDAWDTLIGQVMDMRELAGDDDPQPADSDDVVPWMLRNVHLVAQHPGAESIHDELTFVRRRMEQAVDRSASRIYAGGCGARLPGGAFCAADLWLNPGADSITCDGWSQTVSGCGVVHQLADRRAFLIAELEDVLIPLDVMLDASETLLAIKPERGTALRWRRRGQLMPHGYRHGVELFRGGDVIQLLRDEKPRKGRKRQWSKPSDSVA